MIICKFTSGAGQTNNITKLGCIVYNYKECGHCHVVLQVSAPFPALNVNITSPAFSLCPAVNTSMQWTRCLSNTVRVQEVSHLSRNSTSHEIKEHFDGFDRLGWQTNIIGWWHKSFIILELVVVSIWIFSRSSCQKEKSSDVSHLWKSLDLHFEMPVEYTS